MTIKNRGVIVVVDVVVDVSVALLHVVVVLIAVIIVVFGGIGGGASNDLFLKDLNLMSGITEICLTFKIKVR